jgi:hypothetical protein
LCANCFGSEAVTLKADCDFTRRRFELRLTTIVRQRDLVADPDLDLRHRSGLAADGNDHCSVQLQRSQRRCEEQDPDQEIRR